MPEDAYAGIPYARVQHTKYFVTEKAAYIGKGHYHWCCIIKILPLNSIS